MPLFFKRLFTIFSAIIAHSAIVYGEPITDPVSIGLPFEQYTSTDATNKESITSGIASALLSLMPYILAIAVISLIIAGIYYLISWGNEEKVKKAKGLVIHAILGVIIATSAYTIVNIFNSVTV